MKDEKRQSICFTHTCYLLGTQSLTDHKLAGGGRRPLPVHFTWGPRWCLCSGQSFWGISPSSGPARFVPTVATWGVSPAWVSTPCFHSPALLDWLRSTPARWHTYTSIIVSHRLIEQTTNPSPLKYLQFTCEPQGQLRCPQRRGFKLVTSSSEHCEPSAAADSDSNTADLIRCQ